MQSDHLHHLLKSTNLFLHSLQQPSFYSATFCMLSSSSVSNKTHLPIVVYLPFVKIDLCEIYQKKLKEFLLFLLQRTTTLTLIFDLHHSNSTESPVTISFVQIYLHLHFFYSKCQLISTALQNPLLNVTILYQPFCSGFSTNNCIVFNLLDQNQSFSQLNKTTSNSLQEKLYSLYHSTFSAIPVHRSCDIHFEALCKFTVVAVGGTFDHLHSGHKILLSVASLLCKKRLLIGVSEAHLLQSKQYLSQIQHFSERKETILSFVQRFRHNLQVDVFPLIDVYGPTITMPEIECIVVSKETRKGAEESKKLFG